MKISEELLWRGLVKDKTFDNMAYLDEPKTFYLGVDCSSAASMTIGNLAIFLLARRLLDAGWNTLLLVGGATSLIGDPGGKQEERSLRSREDISSNVAGIRSQVENLFSGKAFTLVDNYEWFKDIGYLEFLRDVGKHYSMTELVQRDYIANRMGQDGSGISYAEFSYSLIQGYDFWHLYKSHNATLQIGGSDQWGNMLSGVPLIRKKEGTEVHALSMPLVIDKTTGRKFGKSEAGAIWLDPELTSPYQFYQFWLNTEDDSVEDFLKIYTFLDKPAIDGIMNQFNENRSQRLAQKTLAYEVTRIVHGNNRADSVLRMTGVLFGEMNYADLKSDDLESLAKELGAVNACLGSELAQVLVDAHLAQSKSEARRFLDSNAIYINGSQIPLSKSTIDQDDVIHGYVVIRRGKNAQKVVIID